MYMGEMRRATVALMMKAGSTLGWPARPNFPLQLGLAGARLGLPSNARSLIHLGSGLLVGTAADCRSHRLHAPCKQDVQTWAHTHIYGAN